MIKGFSLSSASITSSSRMPVALITGCGSFSFAVWVSSLNNRKNVPAISVTRNSIVPICAAALFRRLLLRLAAFFLSASGSGGCGLLPVFPLWGAYCFGLGRLCDGSSGSMGVTVPGLERLRGVSSGSMGSTVPGLGRLRGASPGGMDSTAPGPGRLFGAVSPDPGLRRTGISGCSSSGPLDLIAPDSRFPVPIRPSAVRLSVLTLLRPSISIITGAPARLLLRGARADILPADESLLARGISFSSSFDISINSSSIPIFSSFACRTICTDGF